MVFRENDEVNAKFPPTKILFNSIHNIENS